MNNVVPLRQEEDLHDKILSDLGSSKALGRNIDMAKYIMAVDPLGDHYRVGDWFVKNHLTTRNQWYKAIESRKVSDDLGGIPKTPSVLLELVMNKMNIKINYKRHIIQKQVVIHENMNVGDEITRLQIEMDNAPPSQTQNLSNQLRSCKDVMNVLSTNIMTTEDLGRKVRIKAKELDLPFSALNIDDVIQEKLIQEQANRKTEIFIQIMHSNQRMPFSEAKAMLRNLVEQVFDETELGFDLICAILEKIIWLIKRKMQNLPITNHLMVIFLGPQGVGKSTFMEKFLAPLEELIAVTDFKQLTDDRNIDLFLNFCLIFDEMGQIMKADVDSVKHHATAEFLIRRVMRTNSVVTIKQNATFLGASNREIDQLIRDETGVRRFIGLRFRSQPNFAAVNAVDYYALWQMVDEIGPDPLIPHQEAMKVAQEDIRVMNPCEEWIYSLPNGFGNGVFINSTTLYLNYKAWESVHYSNKRLDHDEWGKELRRLIRSADDFPAQLLPHKKGYQYQILFKK